MCGYHQKFTQGIALGLSLSAEERQKVPFEGVADCQVWALLSKRTGHVGSESHFFTLERKGKSKKGKNFVSVTKGLKRLCRHPGNRLLWSFSSHVLPSCLFQPVWVQGSVFCSFFDNSYLFHYMMLLTNK